MTGAGTQTRIERLLEAMALEEKIGQLNMVAGEMAVTGPGLSPDYLTQARAGRIGSLLNLWGAERVRRMQRVAVEETRLGIPLLFGFDTVHGQRTIFPVPLGEAAAFDPDLWERTARAAAVEAAAVGLTLVFAPMVDVSRDPRWGRIVESAGEDTLLNAQMAVAKVRGFQGRDLRAADSVLATVKHFVGYGAVMGGREYAQVDMSDRTLHEVYLPPFRAAVDAGVAALMPAFNDLAGLPLTAHRSLLTGLVRDTWGFDGLFISDYNAVAELISHGVAADPAEAAALALRAGVDIDMMGDAYNSGLAIALDRGLVTMADIDAAVRRVLTMKERMGLFDDPYREQAAGMLTPERLQAHRELAREAARRSIVLLTNKGGVLPLDGRPRRIAVIGPLADSAENMLGPWAGAGVAEDMVSLLAGLREGLPGASIVHAGGVAIDGEDARGIPAAVDLAAGADLVILCLGEAREMSGEASARGRPGLPGLQTDLAIAVIATGKPVVLLLSSGRPLMATDVIERADAVLATWFLGSEAGHAVADVLSGRFNPTGRLPLSWPVDVGQIPVFHARLPTGRPADPDIHYTSKYADLPIEPLFAFGHGLSYAKFTWRGIRATPTEVRPGDRIVVQIEIANEDMVAGEETVLLFLHDPVASLSRPVRQLIGMAKLVLAVGEVGTARIEFGTDALLFVGHDLVPRLEAGAFALYGGPSALNTAQVMTTINLLDG